MSGVMSRLVALGPLTNLIEILRADCGDIVRGLLHISISSDQSHKALQLTFWRYRQDDGI